MRSNIKRGKPRKSGYQCECCASCCREMVVPVNDADVKRLMEISGLQPTGIVGFFSSRHVDYDADSPLWVRTRSGPRIMALKRTGKGCRFLTHDGRCRFYEHRPSTCRTFPYEIRFIGKSKREDVSRTDWELCQSIPVMVTDRDKVSVDRRQELRDDRQYRCRLRAWEAAGAGRTSDLLAYLFNSP